MSATKKQMRDAFNAGFRQRGEEFDEWYSNYLGDPEEAIEVMARLWSEHGPRQIDAIRAFRATEQGVFYGLKQAKELLDEVRRGR